MKLVKPVPGPYHVGKMGDGTMRTIIAQGDDGTSYCIAHVDECLIDRSSALNGDAEDTAALLADAPEMLRILRAIDFRLRQNASGDSIRSIYESETGRDMRETIMKHIGNRLI